MHRATALALLLLTACTTTTPAPQPAPAAQQQQQQQQQQPAKPALTRMDGFIPLRWDAAQGKLLMEISRFGEELIYGVSLAAGVGSNPIGLDRGQLGDSRIVRFERVGPRVLMIEPNYRFRALSEDPAERRSVADSFAQSVLAGFTVMSEENGAVLVDATEFFLSDQHGISRRLREAQQGAYAVDRNRSAIHLPRTKAFPRNTEIEALLTFVTSDRAGNLVRGVTPTAEIVTIRQRHSFIALPEPGYKPRRVDPRVGVFGIQFYDYASPFTGPLEKRWAVRHRLEKKDPSAAISDPVKPIIYYVDNGVPEPIRSALVDGARWWNRAFEAAGFRNAFQVQVLPPDADPQDVRYHMIHWVHRSTRGWSYGDSVVDPRTGEILKGNVLLGSLRIRQDVMLAQGMIPQFGSGERDGSMDELRDEALSSADPATSPSIMALQRIRQLSAHEVGHTLGLDHNMAASIYGRASVMDYPAPYVKIVNGKLDLSEAYTNSVGPYDIWAIRYAYTQFAPGANEEAELNRIAREALLFVQDSHSRPVSGAHPLGAVWDNGGDPIAMLRHEVEVRRIALEQFGLRNLAVGEPLSNLEEKLLPLYLHHRYQLEAAAKSIGGLYFSYAVKDEAGVSPKEVRRIVPARQQREALAAVMATLDPKFLTIPQRIVDLIPPQAYNAGTERSELFPRRTDPVFDPISAATTSADITVQALLDPSRGARLIQFHAENRENPSLREVHDALLDAAMGSGLIPRATRTLIVTRLVQLAQNREADPQVRAEASDALRRLATRLRANVSDPSEAAHRRATRDDIERFLARPAEPWQPANVPPIPPGPPI